MGAQEAGRSENGCRQAGRGGLVHDVSRDESRARFFGSGDHVWKAAGLSSNRTSYHERAHYSPRLHRERIRGHDAPGSNLQRRQKHALHGCRHRTAARPDPQLGRSCGQLHKDGGYETPHNRLVTWRNHLQQESEWEGEMWGKNANFIGKEAFGNGEMMPRAIQAPGTQYEYNDVRINRFSLSLLELLKKPIPDVF